MNVLVTCKYEEDPIKNEGAFIRPMTKKGQKSVISYPPSRPSDNNLTTTTSNRVTCSNDCPWYGRIETTEIATNSLAMTSYYIDKNLQERRFGTHELISQQQNNRAFRFINCAYYDQIVSSVCDHKTSQTIKL